MSVEHWECPRLWRVGRGSVFVFARVCLIWFLFVDGVYGGCSWWRLQSVRRVSLLFFLKFATIVRSILTLPEVPRAATLSG